MVQHEEEFFLKGTDSYAVGPHTNSAKRLEFLRLCTRICEARHIMVNSMAFSVRLPGSSPSTTLLLCDLGKVAAPLCIFVFSCRECD